MTSKPRVFLMNNYPMNRALTRYLNGTYPGQHLWGYGTLSDKFEWVIPEGIVNFSPSSHLLQMIRKATMKLVGDPIALIKTLVGIKSGDILYAADQYSSILFAFLPQWYRKRIRYIVLVHHFPSSRFMLWSLSRADIILVLSPEVLSKLSLKQPSFIRKLRLIPWGPNLDDIVYRRGRSNRDETIMFDFCCVGRTNRDYSGIRELAGDGQLDGVIADGTSVTYYREGVSETKQGTVGYEDVVKYIINSKCVIVPLKDRELLSGLTEVAAALALNTPILMSKVSFLPFDIQQAHIGLWIDSNSANAIRSAISKLAQFQFNREIALKFNMGKFAEVLSASFTEYLN